MLAVARGGSCWQAVERKAQMRPADEKGKRRKWKKLIQTARWLVRTEIKNVNSRDWKACLCSCCYSFRQIRINIQIYDIDIYIRILSSAEVSWPFESESRKQTFSKSERLPPFLPAREYFFFSIFFLIVIAPNRARPCIFQARLPLHS